MAGQDLTKENDFQSHLKDDWKTVHGVWAQIKDFIDRKVIPKQKTPATDITSSLTCDDGWHDFDFTSNTSSAARWAILSVYFWHGDFGPDVMFGPQGTAADANATVRIPCLYQQASNYGNGGVILLPLDVNQVAAYHVPNFATKKIILLGYV